MLNVNLSLARLSHIGLVATASVFGFNMPVFAQETVVRAQQMANQLLRSEAAELTQTISGTQTTIAQPCSTRAAGQRWTTACGAGFNGTRTMVCVQGKEVVADSTCETARSCGSVLHEQTATVNCPIGTRAATATMQCLDGTAGYTNLNNCRNYYSCPGGQSHGSTWQTRCGYQNSGWQNWQCNDGTSYITSQNCPPPPPPPPQNCNGHAHGSSWQTPCGTGGYRNYTCNNGATIMTHEWCPSPPPPVTWYLGWRYVTNHSGQRGGFASRNVQVSLPSGQTPQCYHNINCNCSAAGHSNQCGQSRGSGQRAIICERFGNGIWIADEIECWATQSPH